MPRRLRQRCRRCGSWWMPITVGAVDKLRVPEAAHYHLYQAMHPQELLNLSTRKRKKAEAKALKMAEGEWEFDSQGRAEMNRDRFKLSMFQLVDALIPQDSWTRAAPGVIWIQRSI